MVHLHDLNAFALQVITEYSEKKHLVFQERVRQCYSIQISKSLLDILNEIPLHTAKIELFLKKNWELIRGTALCYTAIPKESTTRLLCDVAQYVAEQRKIIHPDETTTAIQWLMPGVITKPSRDQAFRLVHLSIPPQTLSIDHLLSLTEGRDGVLRYGDNDFWVVNAWTRVHYPLTVSETQQSELQLFFNEISELDHPEGLTPMNQAKMTKLMGIEPSQMYPDLSTIDLSMVLTSHVLSDQEDTLIPIQLLSDLSITNNILTNPYVDFSNPAAPILTDVSPNEIERLMSHNTFARALCEAKENYALLSNKSNQLLGHLLQLCRKLSFNSAAYAGGIGTDDNAGVGAYPAIIAFHTYYEQLSHEQKERIPTPVKQEIDFLISLSSNPTLNMNATRNLKTCVSTRKDRLIRGIQGHENILCTLGITEEENDHLLRQAKTDFDTAKHALIAVARHYDCDGQDTLGLTKALIQSLGVILAFQSKRDLRLLQTLRPEEIQYLMHDKVVQLQFLKQMDSLEDLVIFLLETSPVRLTALLSTIAPVLFSKMLKTPRHLSLIFISLDPERCRVVCSALKTQMIHVIQNTKNLHYLLTHLSGRQCKEILQTLFGHLPNLIRSATDFRRFFSSLRTEHQQIVYNALLGHLPNMINTSNDFISIIELLTLEQSEHLCKAFGSTLPTLFDHISKFIFLVEHIQPRKYAMVCTALIDHFSVFMKNTEDFLRIFHPLSAYKRSFLFDALKKHLPMIVRSRHDLAYLRAHLSEERQNDPILVLIADLLKISNHPLPGLRDDKVLNDYVRVARVKIFKATTFKDRRNLQCEFSDMLAIVTSPSIKKNLERIKTLRHGFRFFNREDHEKAMTLENSLYRSPITERALINL